MARKKKNARQLLLEQIKKNDECFSSKTTKKVSTKFPELKYKKPKLEGVNIKNPSYFNLLNTNVKVDLNELKEDDILSILNFKRNNNYKYKEIARKLKIFNKLSLKRKNLIEDKTRLLKEKILIDKLLEHKGFIMSEVDYNKIINVSYPDDMYIKDKLIRESLSPFFAYFISFNKPLEKDMNLYDSEFRRAYLLLKYYYDYNCLEYLDNGLVKIKLKENIINTFNDKLKKII